MQRALILPMVVYVFYIWILAAINFRTRLGALKSGKVSKKYFQNFLGEMSSERVHIVGRHFDNQFQAPVIFLIGLCAHLALGKADDFTIVLAWSFIATRAVHSLIHLGKNQLRKRVLAYAAGWFVLCALWGQLLLLVL